MNTTEYELYVSRLRSAVFALMAAVAKADLGANHNQYRQDYIHRAARIVEQGNEDIAYKAAERVIACLGYQDGAIL